MSTSTFRVRTYHRLAVQCTVYFSNEKLHGTGTLWNLSLEGCRIDENLSVRRGIRFELLVVLPGKHDAIIVQEARVTWARGQEFGLRFDTLLTHEAARLEQYIVNNIG